MHSRGVSQCNLSCPAHLVCSAKDWLTRSLRAVSICPTVFTSSAQAMKLPGLTHPCILITPGDQRSRLSGCLPEKSWHCSLSSHECHLEVVTTPKWRKLSPGNDNNFQVLAGISSLKETASRHNLLIRAQRVTAGGAWRASTFTSS